MLLIQLIVPTFMEYLPSYHTFIVRFYFGLDLNFNVSTLRVTYFNLNIDSLLGAISLIAGLIILIAIIIYCNRVESKSLLSLCISSIVFLIASIFIKTLYALVRDNEYSFSFSSLFLPCIYALIILFGLLLIMKGLGTSDNETNKQTSPEIAKSTSPDQRFCRQCGEKVKSGYNFCKNCGMEL